MERSLNRWCPSSLESPKKPGDERSRVTLEVATSWSICGHSSQPRPGPTGLERLHSFSRRQRCSRGDGKRPGPVSTRFPSRVHRAWPRLRRPEQEVPRVVTSLSRPADRNRLPSAAWTNGHPIASRHLQPGQTRQPGAPPTWGPAVPHNAQYTGAAGGVGEVEGRVAEGGRVRMI